MYQLEMLEDITKKMDITKTFDVGITQGSYWGGAQIPYWLIQILTVGFGAIGLDHLLLRSPRTAILKVLSIIPLFGFWYFFDIAQVFGEEESVRKYGFAIPFAGPQGIGGGMFINKDGSNVAPPEKSKPWTFLMYAIASIFFTVLPLNKILIGDYSGAFLQIIMYAFFFTPLILLALIWGFYDEYRVLFDTRGLIEKGAARIIPASWILDPYFKRSALGPLPSPPDPANGMISQGQTVITKIISNISDLYTKTTGQIVGLTTGAVTGATTAVGNVVQGVTDVGTAVTTGAVTAAGDVVKRVTDVGAAVEGVKTVVGTVAGKAVNIGQGVVNKVTNVGTQVADKVAGEGQRIVNKVVEKVEKKAEVMENKLVDKILGKVENVQDKVLETAGGVVDKGVNALGTAIDVAVAPYTAPMDAMGAAASGVEAAKSGVNAVKNSVEAISEVADAAKESAAVLSEKGPALLSKLMDNATAAPAALAAAPAAAALAAAAPAAALAAAPVASVAAKQAGGGLDLFLKGIKTDDQPSDSSMVLLFCVAMLAFGGYVVYTLRKTMTSTEDSKDDTPPESRSVRKSRRSENSQYSDTDGN